LNQVCNLLLTGIVAVAMMPSVPQTWRAGIYAEDTITGEVILDISSASMFRPASTVKLVTTYLGLDILGPSYVWTTELLADTASSALYLIGSGAPLTSAEHVEIMAMETAAALNPLTSWHLYWDTSLFMDESHCTGWDDDDWGLAYCPPIEALSVGDNIVQIIVSTMGDTMRVWTYPDLPGLTVVNRLVPGWTTEVNSSVSGWEDGTPSVTLSGTMEDDSRLILYRPFAGPPSELSGMLARALEESGLVVTGVSRGAVSDTADMITTSVMYSQPPSVLLSSMNKWSRNMVAEMVLRTVSLESGCTPASTGSGCDIGGEVLADLAPDLPDPVLSDGSGLSRLNSLSPRHLAAILQAGAGSMEWGAEFTASLPVNGVDGTLRSRMGNLPAGAFRGKTGTLNDTSSIAGMLTTSSGRDMIVVVMLEVPTGYTWTARAWQDAFMTWIWENY